MGQGQCTLKKESTGMLEDLCYRAVRPGLVHITCAVAFKAVLLVICGPCMPCRYLDRPWLSQEDSCCSERVLQMVSGEPFHAWRDPRYDLTSCRNH